MPPKKQPPAAVNGTSSNTRANSPASTKVSFPQPTPPPSNSHQLENVSHRRILDLPDSTDHYHRPSPICDDRVDRWSHGYDDQDYSILCEEMKYTEITTTTEKTLSLCEEISKSVTQEFSAKIDLHSLIGAGEYGKKQFCLENEVTTLNTQIVALVKQWQRDTLHAGVETWIKDKVEKYVREQITKKVVSIQEEKIKILREEMMKKQEKVINDIRMEHKRRIRLAVLRAVRRTWRKYEARMSRMKLELTVNFEMAAASEEFWCEDIGYEDFGLETLMDEMPKAFKPRVKRDGIPLIEGLKNDDKETGTLREVIEGHSHTSHTSTSHTSDSHTHASTSHGHTSNTHDHTHGHTHGHAHAKKHTTLNGETTSVLEIGE